MSATLRALPEVVAAVNGQAEVLMDGGVRRGTDIAKAICMGAQAVLVGRAYAYGLGAAGHAGVVRALEILRDDFERVLRLMGCASVAELNPSLWMCRKRGAQNPPRANQSLPGNSDANRGPHSTCGLARIVADRFKVTFLS